MKFLFDVFPVVLFFVAFKLFGGIGLMVAFVVAQSLVLAKYMHDEP